jgi:hypothetical protein
MLNFFLSGLPALGGSIGFGDNIVDEEAPVPASPVIYCSQYRMKEYERENGPQPGNEKWPGF